MVIKNIFTNRRVKNSRKRRNSRNGSIDPAAWVVPSRMATKRPVSVSSAAGVGHRPLFVQDSREQDGWSREWATMSNWDGRPINSDQVQVGTLKTGDYSLVGHENEIAIERKSLSDWWGSITFGRERLLAEIDRGRSLKFFAVIIEASWLDLCRDNPRIHRMSGKTSGRTLLSWRIKFPWCHFVTADGRREAAGIALRTLERWHMIHGAALRESSKKGLG